MIVERFFFYPKPGRWGDLAALMKAEIQRYPGPHAHRLYSRDIGSGGSMCEEFEFESYGEREKFWADWHADSGTPAFNEEYYELVVRTHTNELWTLEE